MMLPDVEGPRRRSGDLGVRESIEQVRRHSEARLRRPVAKPLDGTIGCWQHRDFKIFSIELDFSSVEPLIEWETPKHLAPEKGPRSVSF